MKKGMEGIDYLKESAGATILTIDHEMAWLNLARLHLLAQDAPMSSLCRLHYGLKTGDPKDRFYGFLGIFRDLTLL